ncbi:hypothetical protein [Vreelandella piezotolerans]|uniref:Uncharacterized protein n=1 Tax=Vreelandella piezotolerans TaxID=2609667 RepID=A0ABQ6XCY2_9GAMM|nr:hypothetical protein [Halomonas piezotolerans]KAE8439010.1 hypothetical protein F1978_05805 [Halomonas piezotolerans]QJA24666.1 hypothetical protein GYM47_11415 [Halomonas piezotolerans]
MSVASNSIQTPPSQPAHGQNSLTPVQWLSALHGIQPLSQLTLLGAGGGQDGVLIWAHGLAIEKVSLVEASQQQFQHLSAKWQAVQPEWQLHNVVMDAGFNKADAFYIASNSSESGFLAPKTLTHLWPNITEKESQPCEPVTMAEWAKMHWQSSGQWLFIDYFCDASLLTTYAAEFQNVDVLGVRISTHEALPKSITAAAWELALKQAGFQILSRECERHPHIEQWLCVKRFECEAVAAKAALSETKIELEDVKEKLENTQTWFKNRKHQAIEYEKKIVSLEASLESANKEIARIREQSSQFEEIKSSLNQLAIQVSEGFMVQSEQRRQAANALGQHVTKMFKESNAQESSKEKDNL